MVWAPSIITNAVNFSIELSDSSDQTKLNKLNNIITALEKRINSHEMSIRELKACNQLVDKNLNLINEVRGKCEQLKDAKVHISKLFSDIKAQVQERMEKESVLASPLTSTASPEPILNLVFLCDIDAEDRNSAVVLRIEDTMREKIPFVTSKSIICGSDLEDKKKPVGENVYSLILNKHKDWSIYKKGEFVVFIPKSYPFKAEELDFDFTQPIKSIAEILEGPTGKAKIEDFIALFKPNGQVKKRVILTGHGRVGSIGALTLEHYRKLLEFLENSHCESLEIQSCHAGSINAIEHNFDIIKPSTVDQPTIKKRISPTFPISMRSIGNFITTSSAQSNVYTTYFQNLDKWLHEKGAITVPKFQKMLQDIDKSKNFPPESFYNYMQVKFPHQYDAPGGFRPLGEDPNAQIITYTSLRKAEIEKTAIHVDDKKYIEILPSEINVPIKISQNTVPILLSMIPGVAHHLIHRLTVDGFTLDDLFLSNAKIYADSQSEKSFFIGKIDYKDAKNPLYSIVSNIIFHFTQKTAHMFYASGSPELFWHFEFDINKGKLSKTRISENEFCFATLEVAKRSIANKEAMRSATGGQEDEGMFMNSLFHHVFWEDGAHPLPIDYDLYDKYRKNPSKEQAAAFCKNLAPESQQYVLLDAILNNDVDLATLLIPSPHIDVNKKSLNGRTLLFLASSKDEYECVKQLIDRGADLNAPSLPYNKTPLMRALQSNQPACVKIIIDKFEQIDFSVKDLLGWTALQSCEDCGETFNLVVDAIKKQLRQKNHLKGEALKKAFENHLNHITDKGWTALSIMTIESRKNDIETWLKLGADPYLGKPPVLSRAINARNKEMVEFWLGKDYDVMKPDSEGKTALEYAIMQGTPEILSLILKKADLSKFPKASKLLSHTLKFGPLAHAKILLDAGVKVDPHELHVSKYGNFYTKIFQYKDLDLLDKLICEEHKDQHTHLDDAILAIFEQCLQDSSLEFGKRFVKIFEKQLNLFKLSTSEPENFLSLAYKASKSEWIALLMQSGANPRESMYGEDSFLETVIKHNDLETLKICLKNAKGLDLNKFTECNLMVTAYQSHPQMLEPLLQAGGDPTLCSEYGNRTSCLQLIMDVDDEKSFDLCLSFKGLNLNRKQYYYPESLLLQALKKNKISMFKKMVAYGADVTRPRDNMPIKKLITEAKDLELLNFCLSHMRLEVKKEILNKENYLSQAMQNNNIDLFNLLLKHGADSKAKEKQKTGQGA